jgi:predicted  nucleic acid-binding Zn-ribbon protein
MKRLIPLVLTAMLLITANADNSIVTTAQTYLELEGSIKDDTKIVLMRGEQLEKLQVQQAALEKQLDGVRKETQEAQRQMETLSHTLLTKEEKFKAQQVLLFSFVSEKNPKVAVVFDNKLLLVRWGNPTSIEVVPIVAPSTEAPK